MRPGHTHLSVLRQLFVEHDIQTVIEFGCGNGSTPFFVENAGDLVVSVEEVDAKFLRECLTDEQLVVGCRWLGCFHLTGTVVRPSEVSRLCLPDRFDLVFVDGKRDSRYRQVNAAFDYADLIVAHDTECAAYSWGQVKVPDGWKTTIHNELTPWTTVWERGSLDEC